MSRDESREFVFEGKTGPAHRAADRIVSYLEGLPKRGWFRGAALLAALAAVITVLGVARGPSGRAPFIEASSPPSSTPSPTPSIAQSLTGPGPFVIWSRSGPTINGVDLYAADFSRATQDPNPPNIFLGNFLDLSAPLPEAPSSSLMIPLAARMQTGFGIALVRRTGLSTLDPGPLQLGQGNEVLSTADGKQVAVVLHEAGDAYAISVRSVTGSQGPDIPLNVPADIPGAAPSVLDWDASRERFMVAFTGGTTDATSTYELDYSGRLIRLKWLEGFRLLGNGAATSDGSRFVFDDLNGALRIADFRQRSLRTIARSNQFHSAAVLSPDGTFVAFAQGNLLEVARVSDGRVVRSGPADAVSISPLAWIDDGRFIALEQSTDLRTNELTQALVLVIMNEGPVPDLSFLYLASGDVGLNYVGWLR